MGKIRVRPHNSGFKTIRDSDGPIDVLREHSSDQPYWVSFAWFKTSSTSLNLKIDWTGPKISSFAILMCGLTSEKTVGWMKYPVSPMRFPPQCSFTPSDFRIRSIPGSCSSGYHRSEDHSRSWNPSDHRQFFFTLSLHSFWWIRRKCPRGRKFSIRQRTPAPCWTWQPDETFPRRNPDRRLERWCLDSSLPTPVWLVSDMSCRRLVRSTDQLLLIRWKKPYWRPNGSSERHPQLVRIRERCWQPGWKSSFLDQTGKVKGRQRCLLGWL